MPLLIPLMIGDPILVAKQAGHTYFFPALFWLTLYFILSLPNGVKIAGWILAPFTTHANF